MRNNDPKLLDRRLLSGAVLFVFFRRVLTQMRLAVDLLGFGISLAAIDSVDSVLRYDEFTLIISLPYTPGTLDNSVSPLIERSIYITESELYIRTTKSRVGIV